MGFSQLYTDVITALEAIPDPNPILNPIPSKNFQKTTSNRNQLFKMVNVFNEQIDNEIKEKGFSIKCPSIFIEFIPEEPKQILGGYTQYLDAKMYFHIYSDQLNTPNKGQPIGGDFMDANLEIYDLRDAVKSRMLGFHTHNSSAMMSRYDAIDYKHNSITKYILGFFCPFTDEKGSIDDPLSSRYLVGGNLSGGTTSTTNEIYWISGYSYTAFSNIVWFIGNSSGLIAGLYLCITSNNDSVFTSSKWVYLALWQGGKAYSVGAYIYLGAYCYQCSTANSDLTFNQNHWTLICKI